MRSIELNVLQRCASHLASKTDLDEVSKFNEVRNKLNNKEKDDGRTIH